MLCSRPRRADGAAIRGHTSRWRVEALSSRGLAICGSEPMAGRLPARARAGRRGRPPARPPRRRARTSCCPPAAPAPAVAPADSDPFRVRCTPVHMAPMHATADASCKEPAHTFVSGHRRVLSREVLSRSCVGGAVSSTALWAIFCGLAACWGSGAAEARVLRRAAGCRLSVALVGDKSFWMSGLRSFGSCAKAGIGVSETLGAACTAGS